MRAQSSETQTYLAIYYQGSISGGTSYITVGGETYSLSSSEGGIFCYMPALNTTTLVQSYSSPSYSPNYMNPYTVDNHLFLVQVWTGSTAWTTSYYEINPLSGSQIASAGGVNLDDSSWSNYAIVNNSVYYVVPLTYDVLSGWVGGELYVQQFGSSTHSYLLSSGNADNYGQLYSAGGMLFRIQIDTKTQVIDINQIDLATGKIARMQQLNLPTVNNITLSNWCWAADNSTFYIAGQYDENAQTPGIIYMDSFSLASFGTDNWTADSLTSDFWNSNIVYTDSLPTTGLHLSSMDACDGNVLIALMTAKGTYDYTLFNNTSGNATTVQLPAGAQTPQLLELTMTIPAFTLQSSDSSVNPGQVVTLSGSITPSAHGTVILYQSVNGSSFQEFANATLTNGTYSYDYTIPGVGNYTFMASFAGNGQLTPAQSSGVAVTSAQQPILTDSLLYIVAAVVVVAVIAVAVLFLFLRKRAASRTLPPPPSPQMPSPPPPPSRPMASKIPPFL